MTFYKEMFRSSMAPRTSRMQAFPPTVFPYLKQPWGADGCFIRKRTCTDGCTKFCLALHVRLGGM